VTDNEGFAWMRAKTFPGLDCQTSKPLRATPRTRRLRSKGGDDVPLPVSEIAAAVLTLLQAIWNGEASIPAMTRVPPPKLQLRRSA